MNITPDDLLGMREVVDYVKLSKQRIYVLLTDGRFPEPFVELNCGKIWLRQDLDAFLKVERRTGRPAEWVRMPLAARKKKR